MTIETKFKGSDKFWAMDNNKPTQFTVYGISIWVDGLVANKIKILYSTADGGKYWADDREVFPTKEALLQSL